MYRYILFDLDGTLTDPKEGICGSVRYALEKMGIDPPPVDELKCFIGPPLKDSFREFFNMDEEQADAAVKFYRERFSERGWSENEVYPGTEQMLRRAKASGCRLAVASSKPTVFVERILKHFGLRRYFDAVVGSELDGSRSKKEEVVREALERLYGRRGRGRDAEKLKNLTAMVGDRSFDMEGARALGVDAVGVSFGYAQAGELAAAGADAIAGNMEELTELLLGGEEQYCRERRIAREKKDEETQILPMPENALLRSLYVLLPLILYFLSSQLLSRAATAAVRALSEKDPGTAGVWITANSRLVSVWINVLVMTLCAVFLFCAFRKKEPLHFLPLWEKKDALLRTVGILLCGCALAALLNVLLTMAAEQILPLFFSPAEVQRFFDRAGYDHSTPLFSGIVLYVIVSPLLEEIVFRWLLFNRVGRLFPGTLTIVITAFFFGFYHGNILQGIYAFLMGLVMGKLMQKEDGLLAPILFHMSANAFIFLSVSLQR